MKQISKNQRALVVFLRHTGCTFCREALADIGTRRAEIESKGVRIVLVHMSDDEEFRAILPRFGLEDVVSISDPERNLYREFQLQRGRLWQLVGPHVWWRGIKAWLRGNGIGRVSGDVFQMPGTFLIYNGEIIKSFRNKSAADRPDYVDMAVCELPGDQVTE
ncbi:MAG: redoxin domain-containing protein [Acidobacteria bacterium]|nr:redoxin domain-containing protein [Acidobacteriota bacterium]